MQSPQRVIADRFTIDNPGNDLIGRGGMGDVYKGTDTQTGQPVAIKELKPDIVAQDRGMVERFVREGEALRQLNHPNIVKMLAAVEEPATDSQPNAHFLVMEYVSGGSLHDLLSNEGQLSLERTLKIGLELADALTRAHHLGIIHRDLKPANILLAQDGTPRLTDFGIARLTDSPTVTESGMLLGTVSYLCPEACDGKKLDARADIWAFGVLLFEMLAGQRPFTGETLSAILNAILYDSPADLHQYRPNLPPELIELIYRMLEKDRDRRIATARLVAAELETILRQVESGKTAVPVKQYPTTVPAAAHPAPPRIRQISTHQQRLRYSLIDKVRIIWIEGLLENSLHGMAQMELGLEYEPEAVDRPWAMRLEQPGQTGQTLPPRTRIDQVFHRLGGSMLILGEPGSGKTTTLLELARDLLVAAENDEHQPIPVVFNLSSWAHQRLPFDEWLVEELNITYQVNKKYGREWLESEPFRLLLDGLDEVQEEHRDACVTAINEFRQSHGLTDMVVCSRTADYEKLSVQLKFLGAVAIQPLNLEQVDSYMAAAGGQLAAVRQAIREDELLQELVQSPLSLSITVLAYRDIKPSELATGTLEERRNHLFATYVQQMFQRRPGKDTAQEQAIRWLSWLASQMVRRTQTIFHVEQLQTDWLPRKAQRRFYGLLYGVAYGLVLFIMLGLIGWMAYGPYGVSEINDMPETGLGLGAVIGLIWGQVWGLFLGEVWGRDPSQYPVKIMETVSWSWPKIALATIAGGVLGIIGGFILLAIGTFTEIPGLMWSVLVLGGVFGLIMGLIFLLDYREIERKITPNQGIWRTAGNARRIGLMFMIGAAVGSGMLWANGGWRIRGIAGSIVGGLFGWLIFGGETVIRHLLLRYLLARKDYLPLKLVPFLDEMAGRIILRKVGGGYIFIHRMLLEYFADLEMAPPP